MTLAKYSQLQIGLTYEQTASIIGAQGTEMSHSETPNYITVGILWKNGDGSNMNCIFQNGELVSKAKAGLS